MLVINSSGFYPRKSGIEIERNFPPPAILGSGSDQFLTQVFFPLFWASFPFRENILLRV